MLTLREETENRTHELIVNGLVRRATLSDLIRRLEPERGAARPRGLLIHLVSFGGFTAEGLWTELGRQLKTSRPAHTEATPDPIRKRPASPKPD